MVTNKTNAGLASQMKLRIYEDYTKFLKKKKEGTLKFFVREKRIMKSIFPKKQDFEYKNGQLILIKNSFKLDNKALKNFILLAENALSQADPIEYGKFFIEYRFNEAGTELEYMHFYTEEEKHHSY